MYCPICKYEYREGFTICSQCNAELVDNLDKITPTNASNEAESYLQNDSPNPISSTKMDETKALYFIKGAVGAGSISGVTTLIISIYSIIVDGPLGNLTNPISPGIFGLLDAIFVFGITFGIYKKSRVCAVVMFIYFLISKIILLAHMNIFSIGIAVIFLYIFFNGIRGTIYYHNHNKKDFSREL